MDKETIILASVVLVGVSVPLGIIAAVNVITSPTVTVEVHTLTLDINQNTTATIVGGAVEFYGTLLFDDSPVGGETIELYYGNGTFTGLTSTTDLDDGSYSIVWIAPRKGTYSFYTVAEF